MHSRSRTPEVTAGDVLCSSHRPFKPWCTGAGLPLFTPTHNCSHPLTLAHTCSHSHLLTSTTPAHTHSHLLTRANSLCLFPTSAFRDVTWNLELSSSGSVYMQPSANTANQCPIPIPGRELLFKHARTPHSSPGKSVVGNRNTNF